LTTPTRRRLTVADPVARTPARVAAGQA
jgi:hypothetical protein